MTMVSSAAAGCFAQGMAAAPLAARDFGGCALLPSRLGRGSVPLEMGVKLEKKGKQKNLTPSCSMPQGIPLLEPADSGHVDALDGCREKTTFLESSGSGAPLPWHPERLSISSLMEPVAKDLLILNNNLQTVVGSENPLLMAAAQQIFSAGGKRVRPALVLLVSRATAELTGLNELSQQHRQLAEVIEMIHTASLIHDDVLDESDVRRGKETIHQLYGTRVAVLAGDFLFAQASWYLANLENIEVIKLISQVIKDLASGEIKQATGLFDCDTTLEDYLEKSYYKTASLVAASTRSAAVFSGTDLDVRTQMFSYGKNLGLAFQIVDDILDFTRSTEQLGKPAASDLAKGNLTAPVLFALEREPKLREIIDSEFTQGSLEDAVELVHKGGGIEKARTLAKQKGEVAKKSLECLPKGIERAALEGMVDYVLHRLY